MSSLERRRPSLHLAARIATTCLITAACAIGSANVASADTNDSGGFEGFALGNPVGQFGWTAQDIPVYNASHFDLAIVDPSAVWTSGELGTRALRMSNAVTSGGFGNQLQTPSLVNEAGEAVAANDGMSGGVRQTRFSGSFDFASATKIEQPGMVMSMSPDRGDGARMAYFKISDLADGLSVSVVYVEAVAPYNFIETVVASGLSRTQVHHLDYSLDLVDGRGNDVLWTQVGGQCGSWATSGSWEEYHMTTTEGPPPHITKTVDSILFRLGGTAVPANIGGGFLFDNLSFTSSTVPAMPPLGTPTAPVAPSAHVNFTAVAVTGSPVVTNACAPVTTYTVSAWPLGGGAPATFTSPTPNFSFPTPFGGAFTLTMSATSSRGTSADAPVALAFDPVFADDPVDDELAATGAGPSGLLLAAAAAMAAGTMLLRARKRRPAQAKAR